MCAKQTIRQYMMGKVNMDVSSFSYNILIFLLFIVNNG